ncbi:MAG: TonB-dependent receptor [Sphingobacteriaceae bacterium]|nr:MAG: TonB-dependent receptor [Sphingobacteriaceae bacterium]
MKRRFTFFFFMTCLFFVPITIYAQDVQVTGKVISKDDNQPLPGVSVIIKGTTRGTVTGPNGDFNIAVPTGAVLEFSQIGMNAVSVTVINTNPITVSMTSNTAALSEVVVVGYGVQKKKVVTGAISSVKASALESQPITRVEQALQGRVSGVTVAANNGQPGEAATVRVRGLTSFSDTPPLWVVDGIVVDNGGISYLNSSDIESIDVLKDAASQAIYGTRASGGVILVTTKKGKAGTLQLSYNGFYGTSAPARKLKLLNATQYAVIRNEAAAADGLSLPFANPNQYGEGTDWQAAIFNNSAKRQNHEISLSGGNEKSTFYSSFGYLDQEGIVATDISKYKRINFRLNSTHKLFKNFVVGQNFGYAYNKSMGLGNTNSEFGGPLASAIHYDPITPLVETDPSQFPRYDDYLRARRNAEGFPYGISQYVGQEMTNPLAYISTRLGNNSWGHNLVGNAYAELEIIPNLKIRSSFGGKMAFWGSESFTPEFYLNSSNINPTTQLFRSNNNRVDWNISNTISYSRSFSEHNFTLLAGQEFYQDGIERGLNVRYDGIPATTFEEASFGYQVPQTQQISGANDGQYHRVASLFARLNYNYKEKYLFEAVVRRDGSTRFGANYQYGVFPSFGAGWVPSMEDFWPKNEIVDFLKIRGSYGIVGNDNIGDFSFVSTIGSGRNAAIGTDYLIGYSPNAPANPDLRWEETRSANIGLEATIMQNIRFSFDWYNKKTSGILQNPRIPAYVGAISNPAANVADMENMGLEFELGWTKKINDVRLDISGNFSTLKNTVTFLQNGINFIENGAGFQNMAYNVTRTIVGETFNSYYGFRELGIFQTQQEIDQYTGVQGKIQPNAKPGDFKWKDIDGNGVIDGSDREVLGSPLPKYTYGLNVNVGWKNFDLAAFGQGAGGNLVFSGLRRFSIVEANYQTEALNRWTGPGTSTTYPRLTQLDPNENYRKPSKFYLEDGDYFRIKTLQIGYSLPKTLISKAKLSRLRIYLMAENLYTFTKYTGYDPEIGGGNILSIDRGVYPQARSFFVGVNVGL